MAESSPLLDIQATAGETYSLLLWVGFVPLVYGVVRWWRSNINAAKPRPPALSIASPGQMSSCGTQINQASCALDPGGTFGNDYVDRVLGPIG